MAIDHSSSRRDGPIRRLITTPMGSSLTQWAPSWARNAVKRLLGLQVYENVEEGQKGSDFYDRTFDHDDYWRGHYTTVHDYMCWTVLIDRLRTWRARRL